MKTILRLATRKSALAQTQTGHVARRIEELTGVECKLVLVVTAGDRTSGTDPQGKDAWTREVQQAVLNGDADLAVHSLKDLSVEPCPGLTLAAVPAREQAHDCLVSARFHRLDEVPAGTEVGTSSLRRQALLLEHRPDLKIIPLRGNVDTRLKKVDSGSPPVAVMAAAGLRRLAIGARIGELLDLAWMVPAAGQGALGLECRADDESTVSLVRPIEDPFARRATNLERAVQALLGGNCRLPLGVHAIPEGTGGFHLRIALASADGKQVLRIAIKDSWDRATDAAKSAVKDLNQRGADRILAETR